MRSALQPTSHRLDLLALGERVALPALWVVIIILFSFLPETAGTFVTGVTFGTIAGQGAVTLILTLGVMIPMTAGDFDLSVAAILTQSSMIIAILNVQDHIALVPAICAALGAGLIVGVVNGFVTVTFGIDPFIVTLGTSTVVEGVVLFISGQNTITGIAPILSNLVVTDTFLGLPLEFYYAIGLAGLLWFVLTFLPIGRRLLYVGQSREVARLSGVSVRRVRFGALVISGFAGALAGVAYAGTTGSADPTSGTTLLLPAYAACILGSTTILPGRFNPWGSVIGVYFLTTGVTGLELLGASSYVQDVFYGGGLVVAVIISHVLHKRTLFR